MIKGKLDKGTMVAKNDSSKNAVSDYGSVFVGRSKLDKPQFRDCQGVFAKHDFAKGEIVIKWNLRIISNKEFDELPDWERSQFTHKRGEEIFLYPDPERHVNRSVEPNVEANFKLQADIAIRDISKGEEITIPLEEKEDF